MTQDEIIAIIMIVAGSLSWGVILGIMIEKREK
jgi:hypothetical protein